MTTPIMVMGSVMGLHISIVQWGLLSDCYKANPIGQWGRILVIVMGFVDTLGQCMIPVKIRVKYLESQ